jgi:hypothetical protein
MSYAKLVIIQKPWNLIRKSCTKIVQRKAWNLTRTSNNSKNAWNPSSHQIITTNPIPRHQIITTNSTSSRHVQYKYWLTISHSDNFRDVPLVDVSVEGGSRFKHFCKKRRPITFTVNAQEKKAEERTLIKILWQPKEGKQSSNYIHHAINPKTPRSEPPWITRACSGWRYVILKHTYRLHVTHAGDTDQTISTQTLLSPDTLALAPTTTAKLTFISLLTPNNAPTN